MQENGKGWIFAAALLCAVDLAGCGGGGSDTNTAAPTPAAAGSGPAAAAADAEAGTASGAPQPAMAVDIAGLWTTSTSLGDSMEVESFPDGTVWAWYPGHLAGSSGGMMRARTSVLGDTISGTAVVFDFGTQVRDIHATFGARIAARREIVGQTGGLRAMTFQGSYLSSFEQKPSLAAVAGEYHGTIDVFNAAAHLKATSDAMINIDASGAVKGSMVNGCTFTGSLAPRKDGNAFDVAIATAACSPGGNAMPSLAMSGLLRYQRSDRFVTSAGLDAQETAAFLLTGVKAK